jgi:hypothetical protein
MGAMCFCDTLGPCLEEVDERGLMVQDEVRPHPRARRQHPLAEAGPEHRPPAVHHHQRVDQRGDLVEGDEGLDDELLLAWVAGGLVRLQVQALQGLVLPEPAV